MSRKSQKEGKEDNPVEAHQACRQLQETNHRAEDAGKKVSGQPNRGNSGDHYNHGPKQGGKGLVPKGAKDRFMDYGTAHRR